MDNLDTSLCFNFVMGLMDTGKIREEDEEVLDTGDRISISPREQKVLKIFQRVPFSLASGTALEPPVNG